MAKYEGGSRDDVIIYMTDCAIQDREALISCVYHLNHNNPERIETMADCERAIRDFEKLKKSLIKD